MDQATLAQGCAAASDGGSALTSAVGDPIERQILAALPTTTYDDLKERFGWSRGRIYALAVRENARKTEARIRERAADRAARQREALLGMLNQTATCDVLDYLDSLPDECAALVCTSPPYNIGVGYGGGQAADRMRHVFYYGWLLQVVSECARILRPGGSLFLQVGSTKDDEGRLVPIDTMLFDPLLRTGLTFQSRVVWRIQHGLTPKRRLAERYETALVFSKGPEPVFNATPARVPQKEPGKRAFKGERKGMLSGNPLGAHPTNVFDDIPAIGANNGEKTAHPAQFPLALARRAVLLYTMPGHLVVDPFSGSGSTHAACVETGRSFTGADLFYGDVRRERLAKAMPDLVSHLPGVTPESLAVWQAEARRVNFGRAAHQAALI